MTLSQRKEEQRFSKKFHAKCSLMGEHAVLRGQDAIVCPLPEYSLTLTITPTTKESEISSLNEKLFRFMQSFLAKNNKDKTILNGYRIDIHSTIPLSSGLGSSAALCLAMSHWLESKGMIKEQELFSCALELESYFHAKSSGLDIAGVMTDRPILYRMGKPFEPLAVNWQPHLYLSTSGMNSLTRDCVAKVENMAHENAAHAKALDLLMQRGTMKFKEGLAETSEQSGLRLLQEAIQDACMAFQEWGLISNPLRLHMEELTTMGAIACKPTGSGNGGYILSLWKSPPSNLTDQFLKVRCG